MLKIAICDDDYDILIQLEKYLFEISKQENLNLDVEVFTDGELLRRELNNGTVYDMIYMDIQMKNENGITTMHIPLELHADSDCICMTVSDGTACLSDLNCIYF